MNLVEHDISASPVFCHLPKFDTVSFMGFVSEKVQLFKARREGEDFIILGLMIVKTDDKFVWDSCRDLLDQSITAASAKMSGVFQFDLLSFDLHREIKTFSAQELSQVLMNLGRKLAVGRQALLKYSSVYGLLKKLVVEDWGKIVFRTPVDIYYKTPEQLNLLLKKVCNAKVNAKGRKIVVINDLSQEPIFDKGNQAQQARLAKEFGSQMSFFEESPAIFINDRSGSVDLYATFSAGDGDT
ncbi:MAG: hypothetical protein KAR05_00270 [Candidatus Omnitrophica bacterium]|nr:hypothetical protein [Candidatus Omnitrophota bacterium]